MSSITHAPPPSPTHPQPLSHLAQSLCSRAEISSSIQPVGARAHDAALASVSGCDSRLPVLHVACARGPFMAIYSTSQAIGGCEKANIGEHTPLATAEIFALDRVCSYMVWVARWLVTGSLSLWIYNHLQPVFAKPEKQKLTS